MVRAKAYYNPPGGGNIVYVRGNRVTLLAVAEQTGGAFGLVEIELGPGASVEQHLNRHEEKALYVLEGEACFHLPTGAYHAPTGSFFRVARGLLHTIENPASVPTRLLCMTTPGGSEGFYTEVGSATPVGLENDVAFVFAKNWNVAAKTFGMDYTLPNPNAEPVGPFLRRRLAPATGEPLRLFGNTLTLLATSAQTHGQYNIVLKEMEPGVAAPPHVHGRTTGAFYVLDGEGVWTREDGSELPLTMGTFLLCLPGAYRSYRNSGDQRLRLLFFALPGGLDLYYRELSGLESLDGADGIATRHGIEFPVCNGGDGGI